MKTQNVTYEETPWNDEGWNPSTPGQKGSLVS